MADPLFNPAALNIDDAVARQSVAWFTARYGAQADAYRLLACYAAMPLVLTPELLNHLRHRFLANAGLPWVAEVDLLLSELVHPVDYELYAMPSATRAYLLSELRKRVGADELQRVARVLIHYTRHLARTNPYLDDEELRAQQWAAMVYLDETRATAAREVAEAFRAVADQLHTQPHTASIDVQRAEFARLAHITQMLAPQLEQHQTLVEYAALVSRLLAGDDQGVADWGVQEAEGSLLRVPEQLRPARAPAEAAGRSFVDVDVRVSLSPDGLYQTEVLALGEAATFSQALELRTLQPLIDRWRRGGPNALSAPDGQMLGGQLYDFLFARDELALFPRTKAGAPGLYGARTRLRLQIDPPEVAALPWELLYDGSNFLGQADDMTLLRTLSLDRSAAPQLSPPQLSPSQLSPSQLSPPLRLLAVLADTRETGSLDQAAERHTVMRAIGPLTAAGQCEVTWLENATLRTLADALRQQEIHIFYFSGHGVADQRGGAAMLVLADEAGRAHLVGASDLIPLLAGHASLRLAILNTAESARIDAGTLGLAATLVQAGVPAAIGMQGAITDDSAIRFTQRFFDALARGQTIAEAVQASRRELAQATPAWCEWALPVLYTSAPDATLMAPSEDIAVPSAPIHPPEVERALAVLTDWEHYPPEERLKAGDELSRLGDPRRGVGVRPDGLPDLAWCKIPELGPNGQRQFRYHDGKRDTRHPGLPTFWMAQYPITYAQFQAFVDAADGYRNPEWRKGLYDYFGKDGMRWQQRWPLANRPRNNVTWPEAVAFCRWLTAQARRHPDLLPDASLLPQLGKGWSIRLPTEQEWVKAARGFDDRLYPWGGQAYRVGYANVKETEDKTGPHYLQETSPVGMYPHAASPFGVEELIGNVWEFCLNKYDNPDDLGLGGDDYRAARGGSYYWKAVSSSVAARFVGFSVSVGGDNGGFQVICAASP